MSQMREMGEIAPIKHSPHGWVVTPGWEPVFLQYWFYQPSRIFIRYWSVQPIRIPMLTEKVLGKAPSHG